MKRILLTICLCLVMAGTSYGATYYACANANLDATDEWGDTSAGACSCSGTKYTYGSGGFPASGSTLDANGCTVTINITVESNSLVLTNSDANNGFTVATNTSPLTINADIGASSGGAAGVVLTVTGTANANPALTILPSNIYGGSAATKYGLYLSHTVGTVVVGSSGSPATATGGTNVSAYAIQGGTIGPAIIYANAFAATSIGANLGAGATWTFNGNCKGVVNVAGCQNSGAGTFNLTGDCEGASAGYGEGCTCSGTGPMVVVGNIISTATAKGARGRIVWNPGASNYIKLQGTSAGNFVYFGKSPAVSNVSTSDYIINESDGVRTQGTLSASGGGGGAWGF